MYLDKLILSETSIVVLVETLKHLASALNRLLLSEPLFCTMTVMVIRMMKICSNDLSSCIYIDTNGTWMEYMRQNISVISSRSISPEPSLSYIRNAHLITFFVFLLESPQCI